MNVLIYIRAQQGKKKNRQWTDEEILLMIDKINNGYTYQDVTDGTHVPISTLWTRFIN